ncbi:calcium/sodium antiporter [Paracoccaceae bacterium GXU_MW_L88]
MILDLVYVAIGLGLLVVCGDMLVKGAVSLSLRLGIPALIVSMTIVAFGTSAPELLVAIQAALDGAPDIAMGNIVGSNIANILLVLGLPAAIARISMKDCDSKADFLTMLGATVLFIALSLDGNVSRIDGMIMLVLLAVSLWMSFQKARKARAADAADDEDELEEGDPSLPMSRILFLIIVGIIGLPIGAQLLITGAQSIALSFGISEAVIGLTLVAFGTSLPELATTVSAAIRGQAAVALGNVIGSNFFNLMLIMGLTSVITPVGVGEEFLSRDLWIMLAAALAMIPFVWHWVRLGRRSGVVLSALYCAYVALLLVVK